MKSYIMTILLVIFALSSCKDHESFDNNVYRTSTSATDVVLFELETMTAERTLQTSMNKYEDHDVDIYYAVDPSLLSTYNELYSGNAVLLRSNNYALSANKATIKKGSVTSSEIQVSFKNLTSLNKDTVYVLPVTIENASDLGILKSKQTTYYVVKAAALINTVADITSNYLTPTWAKPDICNGLEQLTIEALVNVREYRKLNTIMGIEGHFLIRIGDSDRSSNELQVVTPSGNFPAPKVAYGLPTNEWIHIAVTYDALTTKKVTVYINGEPRTPDNLPATAGAIYLGSSGFYVGRSWDDTRYLDGYISECRIWNVIRTQAEIADGDNPYFIDPTTPGLVAYWKFSEGQGNSVKDYTLNGNNLTSSTNLLWKAVTLPVE